MNFKKTMNIFYVQIKTVWLLGLALLPFISNGQQIDTTFKVPAGEKHAGEVIGYYRHLPANYNISTGKIPMILFLHGSGESKKQSATVTLPVTALLQDGTPPKILQQGTTTKLKDFIVISPQAPYKYWDPEFVRYIIEYMTATYPKIDPDRIYLTGLSMGGSGCWQFAQKYPEKIAAMIPIAASGSYSTPICNLELPIWSFWGESDTYKSEKTLVKSYNDSCVRQIPAIINMIPKAIHSATLWGTVYKTLPYTYNVTPQVSTGLTESVIYDWLLNYTRSVNTAPSASAGVDKTVLLPINNTNLIGSGTDTDSSIASYNWAIISGPGGSIANTSSPTTSVTGLTAGNYVFRLTVTDDKNAVASDDINVTVIDPLPIYRINAGGEPITDTPISWEPDRASTSRSPYLDPASSNHTTGSTFWSGINNSDAPNYVFGNHRYKWTTIGGPMMWNFPVANGEYMVKLYFFDGTAGAVGARVFDVSIEGNLVLDDFDIYAEFGNTANQKNFQVNITDGIIDIDFANIVGYSRIDGIEIAAADTNSSAMRAATIETIENTKTVLASYPQPFNIETTIEINAITDGPATLTILDTKGSIVTTLFNNNISSGNVYTIPLNASMLNEGVYIAVLKTSEGTHYHKLIVSK